MAFSIMSGRRSRSSRTTSRSIWPIRCPAWGAFRVKSSSSAARSDWCCAHPGKILTIEELLLPPVLKTIADEVRGLILVRDHRMGKSTCLLR